MSVTHGDLDKRKSTGGRRHAYRVKRKFDKGSFPVETMLGEVKKKTTRGRGNNVKRKVLADKYACVTDAQTGKTEKVEILRVARNPANIDYNRRGVITKGAMIETPKGLARVTSRPGQQGVINAVLVKEEK